MLGADGLPLDASARLQARRNMAPDGEVTMAEVESAAMFVRAMRESALTATLGGTYARALGLLLGMLPYSLTVVADPTARLAAEQHECCARAYRLAQRIVETADLVARP